jgi:integrase
MRQAGAKAKSSMPRSVSKNSTVIESAGRPRAKRRVFGTGGIFEKNGSRFLYTSYRDMNGKLRQESTKSESLMVAERLLRDRLGKVEQGLPVVEMKKLKYEDIRKPLIMDYRARGVKMLEEDADGSLYVWGFEHLGPFFKNRLVRTITTDLLYQFVEKRQREGAKNATINRNLSLLRRKMNLARREGRSIHAPYFPMLKENNIRKGFIIPAQFIKLRDAMPEHLRPLMTFLYFTGCRVGAALAITWSQIECEKGRFQLRIEGSQTKNEEPLLLPLPLELNEVLKKLPHEGRVFDARNLRKSFQAA